ncbi:MAG: hypothetical protein KGQ26_02265 [Rhodospirillales bacterium]|nr:hypothetical protein [Rhodospirillales bacterium]
MAKFSVSSCLRKAPRRISILTLASAVLFFCAGLPAQAKMLAPYADIVDIANLMLVPLPNQSMNQIKGGGLQGPGLGSSASPAGTITLWDELKPPGQIQNAGNGMVTITVNGLTR